MGNERIVVHLSTKKLLQLAENLGAITILAGKSCGVVVADDFDTRRNSRRNVLMRGEDGLIYLIRDLLKQGYH